MSTVTLTFTGASIEEVHDQLMQYGERAGIIDLSDWEPSVKPIIVEGVPASAVVETTAPMATPIPATATACPFVGECGEFLKKDFSTPELFAWLKATPVDDESQNWTAAGCNRRIKHSLKVLPPMLAAAAREFAATHKYGSTYSGQVPDELIAEYLYVRWMSGQENLAGHAADCLQRLHPSVPMSEYIHPKVQCREIFEQKRIELAAKLIKEHGWKAPKRGSFAGTEFQQIAIDSKSATFPDGRNIEKVLYVNAGPMNAWKLNNTVKGNKAVN